MNKRHSCRTLLATPTGCDYMTDVLYLIRQAITTDNYGREVITETNREVYCEVDSVSQSEFYSAANTELQPEYRFTVFFGDYNGEDVCEFHGKRYAIYRTYQRGDDLELYVERQAGA